MGVGETGAVLSPSVVMEQPSGKRDPQGYGGLPAAGGWHASEMARVKLGAFRGKTKHQPQSPRVGEPLASKARGAGFYLFIWVRSQYPDARSPSP